jgi:hypothetical protein
MAACSLWRQVVPRVWVEGGCEPPGQGARTNTSLGGDPNAFLRPIHGAPLGRGRPTSCAIPYWGVACSVSLFNPERTLQRTGVHQE